MVDVLVSSGLPKPWLACQKEAPALHSAFISGYSAPMTLEKPFSVGRFVPYTSCRTFPKPSPTHQKPCLHLRSKDPVQRRSKSSVKTMYHSQPSIESPAPVKELFDYIPEQIEIPGQASLSSSSSEFMAASAMKTTASSGSLNEMLAADSANYFSGSFTSTIPDTSVGLVQAMSTADIDWTVKADSFASITEDTPSISSSFDFPDPRKEDASVYHGLHFYPQEGTCHAVNKPTALKTYGLQYDYPMMSVSNNEASWGLCSAASDPDSWRQPYVSDNISDEQAWAAAEYFPSSWAAPEANSSRRFIHSPDIQPYEPYHQIQLPSLDHPILGHPSTPITSEPDTEHTNALSRSLETNLQPYQGYIALNPTPQETNPPHLHSIADYNQPSIPPPPTITTPHTQQEPDEPVGMKASLHYSDSRNAFLINCKRRGLSYKDIKRIGGFKEAESTLRGRFRTLTKTKEQRVRKPKWLDQDIKLLCDAVRLCSKTSDTMSCGPLSGQAPKVPWKKVAQYIWAQGGSYQFGNATCKKKWCEIHDIRV